MINIANEAIRGGSVSANDKAMTQWD